MVSECCLSITKTNLNRREGGNVALLRSSVVNTHREGRDYTLQEGRGNFGFFFSLDVIMSYHVPQCRRTESMLDSRVDSFFDLESWRPPTAKVTSYHHHAVRVSLDKTLDDGHGIYHILSEPLSERSSLKRCKCTSMVVHISPYQSHAL